MGILLLLFAAARSLPVINARDKNWIKINSRSVVEKEPKEQEGHEKICLNKWIARTDEYFDRR